MHIQKVAPQKLPTLGYTLEEFNNNLRNYLPVFSNLLNDIKENEGGGTFGGLIQALSFRRKNDMRPFTLKKGTQFDMILADGFYAVHHAQWTDHFNETQILVINGNEFCKYNQLPHNRIRHTQVF